jgi:carbonic anhydrase
MKYTIHDIFIKINHIGINDNDPPHMYKNSLDEYEAEDLIQHLVNFVKIIATKENKLKITMDVHENLRLYMKYYYYNGFKTTDNKCVDNPFWIETELIL